YALRQIYYTPYEDETAVRSGSVSATWWATRFKDSSACPFKSSGHLIEALEQAVGETVDITRWKAQFPVDSASKPLAKPRPGLRSCLWNCCFHVKPDNGQQLGHGVHNHVTDSWNSVGADGWAGVLYLNPVAPIEGGLHLWRNINREKQFDWMTPPQNWQLVDSFGNLFNRLILVRGDLPHSGAGGWGSRLEEGRMYQTFFFHTTPRRSVLPVSMSV
ncbi:MAG: hypothetical protein WA741_03485, partial [Candidatus Sulfotelmatobacter sp.]